MGLLKFSSHKGTSMVQQKIIVSLLLLCLHSITLHTMVGVEKQKRRDQLFIKIIKTPRCSKQSLQHLQTLLNFGANPNTKDESNTPAIILAAQAGNSYYSYALTKLLLDAQADINAQDAEGNTALIAAVQQRRADLAAALLLNKADPSILNNNKESYHDIAFTSFIKIVNATLSHYKAEQEKNSSKEKK